MRPIYILFVFVICLFIFWFHLSSYLHFIHFPAQHLPPYLHIYFAYHQLTRTFILWTTVLAKSTGFSRPLTRCHLLLFAYIGGPIGRWWGRGEIEQSVYSIPYKTVRLTAGCTGRITEEILCNFSLFTLWFDPRKEYSIFTVHRVRIVPNQHHYQKKIKLQLIGKLLKKWI